MVSIDIVVVVLPVSGNPKREVTNECNMTTTKTDTRVTRNTILASKSDSFFVH